MNQHYHPDCHVQMVTPKKVTNMHFLSMGDTFKAMDGPDALAILMLAISLLAILASVCVSKWTARLATANQLNRQLKLDRHQKLIRHNLSAYRGVGKRPHKLS